MDRVTEVAYLLGAGFSSSVVDPTREKRAPLLLVINHGYRPEPAI